MDSSFPVLMLVRLLTRKQSSRKVSSMGIELDLNTANVSDGELNNKDGFMACSSSN